MQILSLTCQNVNFVRKQQLKMLVLFLHILAANTTIVFCYNFRSPLNALSPLTDFTSNYKKQQEIVGSCTIGIKKLRLIEPDALNFLNLFIQKTKKMMFHKCWKRKVRFRYSFIKTARKANSVLFLGPKLQNSFLTDINQSFDTHTLTFYKKTIFNHFYITFYHRKQDQKAKSINRIFSPRFMAVYKCTRYTLHRVKPCIQGNKPFLYLFLTQKTRSKRKINKSPLVLESAVSNSTRCMLVSIKP